MDNKELELLPYKIQRLEEQSKSLKEKEENNEKILMEIREGLVAIKEALTSNKEQVELKNQLLNKDIEGMKERVEKLEANQRWLVLSIIAEVIGIIFGIVMIIIEKSI